MPFSFTFKLSVPGLSNPFSPGSSVPVPQTPASTLSDRSRTPKFYHRQGTPDTSKSPSPLPISRKRGWEPTFAEPTPSTTTLSSTKGYLDSPGARYREIGLMEEFQEVVVSDTEMPPPTKRRRGLAGSIVSTALSAALIGTAVGLTVYRLWRDRGKQPDRIQQSLLPPPPPYEWTPQREERQAAPLQITPASPRNNRKTRHPVSSTSKRPVTLRRTPRAHAPPPTSSPALFPRPQPEFNFDPEPTAVEEQMDWIGDKLSMLIEEGKKALGREVVVMSDAKEDEVDDGSGAWEEEEPTPTVSSASRSSSLKHGRKRRPHGLISEYTFVPQQLHTPEPSPKKAGFEYNSTHSSPSRGPPTNDISATPLSMTPSTSYTWEDERAWDSPELRESMERARAKYLRNRGT